MQSTKNNIIDRRFSVVKIYPTPPELAPLHEHVLRNRGRVELVDQTGGTSILMSKSELEALEQALEILGQTEAVRAMHIEVARVAAASMLPA